MAQKNKFEILLNRIGDVFRSFPITALLCAIGGILLIIFPEKALSFLIRLIGSTLFLYGVLRILAITAGSSSSAWTFFRFASLLGAISLCVVALVLILSPSDALGFLTVITGLYLVFDGVIKLYRLLMSASLFSSMYGITTDTKGERVLFLALCFLTVGAGLWLLIWPGSAIRTIAVVIGISLLISGGQNGFSYYVIRKKQRQKDLQEGNFYTDNFVDKSN